MVIIRSLTRSLQPDNRFLSTQADLSLLYRDYSTAIEPIEYWSVRRLPTTCTEGNRRLACWRIVTKDAADPALCHLLCLFSRLFQYCLPHHER